MYVCLFVCVCAHAHVFVSVPVFVLRPLLFPSLECWTNSLWSECKIDQIEFTDHMPLHHLALQRKSALILKRLAQIP